MDTAKERLLKIIDETPDYEIDKLLDFPEPIKAKEEKSLTKDLTKASESSLDFWDNDMDDKVWNDE